MHAGQKFTFPGTDNTGTILQVNRMALTVTFVNDAQPEVKYIETFQKFNGQTVQKNHGREIVTRPIDREGSRYEFA